MSNSVISPPERRYVWRFFLTMAMYVLVLKFVYRYFHQVHPTGALAIALAILPALPILASIVVAGLYLKEQQDEFIRMLYVRAILMGVGVTLAVTSVVGYLQFFNIVHPFPLYHVFTIFWITTGFAQGCVHFFYRGRNE